MLASDVSNPGKLYGCVSLIVILSSRVMISQRDLRRWLGFSDPADPAVAELAFSGRRAWPPDFALKRYPGLLRCELLEDGDGRPRLLTFWHDETARHLRLDALAKDLGAEPVWTGFLSDVRTPPAKWFHSSSDFLIKAAAIVGAVTVLSNLFATYFAGADMAIIIPSAQPIDAAQGDRVPFSVLIVNSSRTTPLDATVSATTAPPNEAHAEAALVNVPAGGQANLALSARFVEDGEKLVTIKAVGAAGRFRRSGKQDLNVRIKVHPPVSWSPLTVQRITGSTAFLRTEITTGLPGSTVVQCDVTADDVKPDVQFLAVSPSIDGEQPKASEGEKRVITMQWQTPIRAPFRSEPVVVSLAAEQQQPARYWADLANRIRFYCEVKNDPHGRP